MTNTSEKKTKREQVYAILDSQGHILDAQTFKIFGENWTTVAEYTRAWNRMNADKEFFLDKKIIEKIKGHRSHLVRVEGQDSYFKVGKEFYNSIDV